MNRNRVLLLTNDMPYVLFITMHYAAVSYCCSLLLTGVRMSGKKMGLTWHGGGVGVSLLLALIFVFSFGEVCFCEGGRTSAFVRNNDYFSQDMPIDSDVFRVPPGYNAPQQVFLPFLIEYACSSALFFS